MGVSCTDVQDPGETHSASVVGLKGRTSTDQDLEAAMLSPRLSTVQSAMEHALRSKNDYDPELFKRVKKWYNELDRRMGLLKYCRAVRGQGWDGECLAVTYFYLSFLAESRLCWSSLSRCVPLVCVNIPCL